MNTDYHNHANAQYYLEFLDSPNGKIQQDFLLKAIQSHLGKHLSDGILDVACGPGWLSKKLIDQGFQCQGCDSSQALIDHAQQSYPTIPFQIADVTSQLPYGSKTFHTVIFNMAALDVDNLEQAWKHISEVLADDGQLLVTIPHPSYTYPAAEWKRSLRDVLTGKKPSLRIRKPLTGPTTISREFIKGKTITSHFYPLSHYINTARTAGLRLVTQEEIMSIHDSPTFNLQYQLHRYPLFLLLKFTKK